MADEPTPSTNRELTAEIVAAYVGRNQMASDQLGTLISTVHQALTALGKPPTEAVVERMPAVTVRRSVSPNAVVCLDCGWKGKVLRRHIGSVHGLTPEAYRTRWELKADHPLVAPAYSERRSDMAKQVGLGQRGRGAVKAAAPTQPAPKRRGRPRKTVTSTGNA
jgi:predicted transcriptional regulator